MATNSEASFASTLTERLAREFPDLAFTCKGARLGPAGVRVMRLMIRDAAPFQFPFPPLGTHTEEVNRALLATACKQVQFLSSRCPPPSHNG